MAYRQQKWRGKFPGDVPAWGGGLTPTDGGGGSAYRAQSVSPYHHQPSASNCLRSIVQSICQNSPGRAAETTPPSPRVVAASPVDSRGSSPLLSPAPSPGDRPRADGAVVVKVEPDDVSAAADARPGSGSCEAVAVSPGPPPTTGRDDAWSVGRADAGRPHPNRVICRLMPRVMGNATPMLRAMLGKRRRTASLSSDLSTGPTDAPDSCKSPATTTQDAACQCDALPATRPPQEDAGVQCELIASGCARLDDGGGDPDERCSGERYSGGRLRCLHCGVSFDDDVLHSLHMGCHSHRDPFICNVCGRQCSDRYGFYTHIMRGHQSP